MSSAIYTAIAEAVDDFANTQSEPLAVAYPGVAFTPPTSGMWLELISIINDGQNYGLDLGHIDQGFFRVVVCFRPGGGIVSAQLVAEEAQAYFPKGTDLAGALVYRKPAIGTDLQDDEKSMIPVTVWWRASS